MSGYTVYCWNAIGYGPIWLSYRSGGFVLLLRVKIANDSKPVMVQL